MALPPMRLTAAFDVCRNIC